MGGSKEGCCGHLCRVIAVLIALAAAISLAIGWGVLCLGGQECSPRFLFLDGTVKTSGWNRNGTAEGRSWSVEGSEWGLKTAFAASSLCVLLAFADIILHCAGDFESMRVVAIVHVCCAIRFIAAIAGGLLGVSWSFGRVSLVTDKEDKFPILVRGWAVGGSLLLSEGIYALLESIFLGCPCLVRSSSHQVKGYVKKQDLPKSPAESNPVTGKSVTEESDTEGYVYTNPPAPHPKPRIASPRSLPLDKTPDITDSQMPTTVSDIHATSFKSAVGPVASDRRRNSSGSRRSSSARLPAPDSHRPSSSARLPVTNSQRPSARPGAPDSQRPSSSARLPAPDSQRPPHSTSTDSPNPSDRLRTASRHESSSRHESFSGRESVSKNPTTDSSPEPGQN